MESPIEFDEIVNDLATQIPLLNLAAVGLLVGIVVIIYVRWSLPAGTVVYASGRMLLQLLVIGYFLTFIFAEHHPVVVFILLGVMLAIASWISLRSIGSQRRQLYFVALAAIGLGGVPTLFVVVLVVLNNEPWYRADVMIPLAGMIFANAMNAVSLAAERYHAEITSGSDPEAARRVALHTSLIPITNSFMAVGLVSLPGMMTGQILSGVSPLIAARYQIMVMCMLFGSGGIASAAYLTLSAKSYTKVSGLARPAKS